MAAVAPPEVVEIGGWLVPFSNGTIGRAKSAAPLGASADIRAMAEIAEAYRARGLSPAFRIPDSFISARHEAARLGFTGQQPTLMKTGDVSALAAFSQASARLLDAPTPAWSAVFTGPGFDPADGAHRVAALSRAPGAVYGAAGEGDAIHAVGVASFDGNWAGIHGMRTTPEHRGRGHAAAILAAFGRRMAERGASRVFLQVEAANPARRIYRRAGFTPAWTYRYWR